MRGSGFRLRPTLVTTIVGLVLLTVAAIGGSAAYLTLRNTRELIDQSRTSAVAAASGEVRRLFELGPRIMTELVADAQRGVLPLDDPHKLAARLIERLRLEPQLAWISYASRDTGVYIGATRWNYGSSEIVEYIADPNVEAGMPQQTAVAADGTRTKPDYAEKKPYLVLTREWFKKAIDGPELVTWLPPYQFITGGLGVTAVMLLKPTGSDRAIGLFHVDLRLEAIAGFLSTLKVGSNGAVFLAYSDGRRIVSPGGPHVAAAEAALDAAAAARRGQPQGSTPLRVAAAGQSYEVVFAPVDVTGNIGLAVAVVVNLADITAGVYHAALIAALVGLAATLAAILLGIVLSSRIARPVVAIARDLADIGAFRLSTTPAPQSFVREIGELGRSVDAMKASLRSFGRYVPTDLVRAMLAAGREAELGGEIRRLTIHFSDVADFTAISERMETTQLVAAMGRYFAIMTEALSHHGGTVDKFMGDGILAFFNAPLELADHPRRACLAALEAQAALAVMARDAAGKGQPVFRARIGLGLGDVLVGNIGTPERFAYTVIGDEVNLASRLEGLNKVYGTAIMASDALVAATGDAFEWRRLDRVAVKGRTQGTLVCELLGERGSVAPDVLAVRDAYERALERYFAADFSSAAVLFADAMTQRPNDLAAQTMHARVLELVANPPGQWDGVHVMHEK
jgi:adenylate cyclase